MNGHLEAHIHWGLDWWGTGSTVSEVVDSWLELDAMVEVEELRIKDKWWEEVVVVVEFHMKDSQKTMGVMVVLHMKE